MLSRQGNRITRFFPGIHYAWIIIAIAAFMHMAGGSVRQAFGVLVVPLQQDMGWSPASITLAYALGSIVGAAMAPLSGIATDRFGARVVIVAGILFFFLGAIITGAANQVWHLWISYGIFLGVAQACFSVPILTVATAWFRTRLGVGIGLLQAAHGLGPAVMAVFLSALISALTWKIAFWLIGLSASTVMIGLMLFFRNEPSDVGLRPYGAAATEPAGKKADPAEQKQRARAFLVSMQGTNAFWQLVAVHFLGCVGHAIVIIYIIPIAVTAGINMVSASGILGTLMAVSVLTRFLTPVVADYLGAKRAMATMFVLQGLPVLMLFWTQELWQFYLFAVIFGIGYGGEGSAFPIINRQYFGRGPMGRSFGWQQAGAGTGMAVGGWIGGVLYLIFGSYDITVILSVLASMGGAALILSMPPTAKLLIPNWEDASPSDVPPARTQPIASSD
ncbi:MAG: MFS transporter [Chloroflexi bacterium]|nr:MFS transporter [Chloroflexota bacterium]